MALKLQSEKKMLNLAWDCEKWRKVSVLDMEYETKGFEHQKIGVELEGDSSDESREFFKKCVDEFFTYKFYAPPYMHWHLCNEDGSEKIQEGTIIIQRFLFGPFSFEAAVKVTEVFDKLSGDGHEKGFVYRMLEGHPEKGRVKFAVRRRSGQKTIRLKIESWTLPTHWLFKLGWGYLHWTHKKSKKRSLKRIIDRVLA